MSASPLKAEIERRSFPPRARRGYPAPSRTLRSHLQTGAA